MHVRLLQCSEFIQAHGSRAGGDLEAPSVPSSLADAEEAGSDYGCPQSEPIYVSNVYAAGNQASGVIERRSCPAAQVNGACHSAVLRTTVV